jgi:cytochrome c biogenesis protein CcdA
MILELLVAATVGVSFANTWMCVLLSFGAATEGVEASKYFIAGRFLGVLALGVLIASLRLAMQDYMPYVFLAFGLFSVLFGVLVLGRQYLERKAQKMRAAHRPDPAKCKACGKCSVENKKDEDLFKATCNCDVFGPIGASCDHDAHELEAREKKKSRFGPRYGLALGLFRGATPCAKMMLLAPLLIVSDIPVTIGMLLVYAAASTVYPVIGLMSARIISKVKLGSIWIKAAGAMVVLIVGIYSIMKFVTWDPNQCFQ